jgi:hypothetical protein
LSKISESKPCILVYIYNLFGIDHLDIKDWWETAPILSQLAGTNMVFIGERVPTHSEVVSQVSE